MHAYIAFTTAGSCVEINPRTRRKILISTGREIDEPPTITRLLLPAPTRIRAVAASKESYLLLAETGIVYEGLFDDKEPRPIEALAQARCRSVACGEEHYLVATFDGSYLCGNQPARRVHSRR